MKRIVTVFIFIFFSVIGFSTAFGQQRLKVFLDCSIGCDLNYLRSEVSFAEFIAEKLAADVYISITQGVNNGAQVFTLQFNGQNVFSNSFNTIIYNQPLNTTDNDRKIQIAKRIRIGLIPFTKAPPPIIVKTDPVAPAQQVPVIVKKNLHPVQYNNAAKLKVYLDCNADCDDNYIRSDLSFVDFVRDRIAADVHVLITSQKLGGGGDHVQMIFFGQQSLKSRTDTINIDQSPNSTKAEKRSQITNRLRYGLIPFITKISNDVLFEITKGILKTVGNDPATKQQENLQTKDKWNYWVFRLGGDATLNVDQNYRTSTISTSASANRTTNKSRITFSASNNNTSSSYKYDNNGINTTYKFSNQNYQFGHSLVAALSKHWSMGYELAYSNNTFSNNKNRKYAGAGIEYAVFPYSQVNTKFFAISYTCNVRHNNYYDTTLFDKISETLLEHEAKATFSLKQKWGDINSSITYSNYFKDWKLNNLSMNLSINLRVTGGLFFYIYSYGEIIHDQIYLAKGNASVQDILARRRQLASSFSVYSGAGLSFRFGSILNNFVNPRLSSY